MKTTLSFGNMKLWLAVIVSLVALLAVACSSEEEAAPSAPAPSAAAPSAPAPSAPAPSAPAPAPKAPAAPVAISAPAPAPAPRAAPAPTGDGVDRGGVFVRRMGGVVTNWDILQGGGSGASEFLAPAYSQLLQWAPEDGVTIEPDLAESWKVSNGGLTFTFDLRSDAKFSDGRPVTAEDVKWTYERIIDPPEGMVTPRAGAVPEIIDTMDVVDANTIAFNLTYSAQRPSLLQSWHPVSTASSQSISWRGDSSVGPRM